MSEFFSIQIMKMLNDILLIMRDIKNMYYISSEMLNFETANKYNNKYIIVDCKPNKNQFNKKFS